MNRGFTLDYHGLRLDLLADPAGPICAFGDLPSPGDTAVPSCRLLIHRIPHVKRWSNPNGRGLKGLFIKPTLP